MKAATKSLLLVPMTVLAAAAHAQFVKGNEAVRLKADGTREVVTPPMPAITLGPPCKAEHPGCWSSPLLMVETSAGLNECTEFYARPGTCRASTYGSVRRPRLWLVLVHGQWLQCPRPDASSGCLSTKALPPATQLQ